MHVLVHRDTGNILVDPPLTVCMGPLTSVPRKGLANDEQKKWSFLVR